MATVNDKTIQDPMMLIAFIISKSDLVPLIYRLFTEIQLDWYRGINRANTLHQTIVGNSGAKSSVLQSYRFWVPAKSKHLLFFWFLKPLRISSRCMITEVWITMWAKIVLVLQIMGLFSLFPFIVALRVKLTLMLKNSNSEKKQLDHLSQREQML